MKKKIKRNCLLLAVLLLAQVLLEPLAIFANNYGQNPGIFSGGGGRPFKRIFLLEIRQLMPVEPVMI